MKTARLFIILLATVAVGLTACNKSTVVKTVDADSFEQQLAQTTTPQLVDVRTFDEYNEEHLPGAVNFSLRDEEAFSLLITVLNKEEPVFVYCGSGKRSAKAASILEKNGFTTIYNLDGGITAWKEKGKAVE